MHKQRSFVFPANDTTYNWLEASKDSEGVLTGFFSALVLKRSQSFVVYFLFY